MCEWFTYTHILRGYFCSRTRSAFISRVFITHSARKNLTPEIPKLGVGLIIHYDLFFISISYSIDIRKMNSNSLAILLTRASLQLGTVRLYFRLFVGTSAVVPLTGLLTVRPKRTWTRKRFSSPVRFF